MKLKFFTLAFFTGLALCFAKNTTMSINSDREIIYLKTDRDVYEVGERVWFSTIHLGSKTLAPKYNSSVLYFLLLDKEKKVIDRKKFQIRKGTTNGSYLIPNHLEEGVYYILTYTQNSLGNLLFLESTKPIMVHKILPKRMYIEYNSHLGNDNQLNLQVKFHKKNKQPVTKARVQLTFWDQDKKEKSLSYKLKNSPSLDVIIKNPENSNLNYIKVDYSDNYHKETFFLHLPNVDEEQISFFPEGGFVQFDQEQFIGYKIKSNYRKPEFLYIYENNKFLKKVSANENGVGKFSLQFNKGSQYHVLTQPDAQKTFPIAFEEKKENVRISLEEGSDTFKKVLKISPSANHTKEQITLKVFSKGKITQSSTHWVQNDVLAVPLDLSRVFQGVYLVCAYNNDGDLLSHRFGFLKNPSSIDLSIIKKPKQKYKAGQKINLSLSPTLNSEPVTVRYSTSIFKKTLSNTSFDKNLFLHYLLDSEFVSSMQNIAIYNSTKTSDINDLLLSMSLEDYRWNPKNNFPKIHATENIRVLALQKPHEMSTAPAANMSFVVRCDKGLYTYTSDSNGLFKIDPKMLSDKKCYLLPSSRFGRKILIEVKDLLVKLDPIISELDKFEPAEYITLSTSSKPFIDIENFSFSNTNLLDDINFSKDFSKNKKEKVASINKDFVCTYNILNCKNHVGHWENREPIAGQMYVIPLPGYNNFSSIVYTRTDYEYPEQIFTFERSESFQKIASTSFDIHHKTSLWSPFQRSKEAGKINLQLIAPETQGTYVMAVEAYDHKGNLGTYQVEFVVK